jgi:hypothetical protein
VLSGGVDANQENGKEVNPNAKNDAEDMASFFQKQSPGLYRDVQSRVLTGANATSSNILDGFDWLRQKTESDAVVVIVLMGHGENEGGKFQFVAYGDDTKIGYDEIQRCLSALPGRVIIFVGGCESGSAARRVRNKLRWTRHNWLTRSRVKKMGLSFSPQRAVGKVRGRILR